METVKKTKEYQIIKKRSGRYAVLSNDGKWLKADEKVKVLMKEGLIKLTPKKVKVESPPEAAAQ